MQDLNKNIMIMAIITFARTRASKVMTVFVLGKSSFPACPEGCDHLDCPQEIRVVIHLECGKTQTMI